MKRSIARKWAKALESGEYKKTTGMLRRDGGWCCLGVLCNLHAQEHPEIAATQKTKGKYLGERASAPDEVCDWAGISHSQGRLEEKIIIDNSPYKYLAEINDATKLTFPEIAKIIRKHYKEL